MALTEQECAWYYGRIRQLDPQSSIVTVDSANGLLIYNPAVRTDESRHKPADPEELVHALAICMLVQTEYSYPLNRLYHEKYYKHGQRVKSKE